MKYCKYFLTIIIVFNFMFLITNNVEAKTLNQIKKELSDAEQKYSSNQSDKAQTEEEIQKTKDEISYINKEKTKVYEDINDLNEEIKQLTLDIEDMNEEIKKMMNYYQLSNSDSLYLEYVFNASSFTDFIYRLAVTEQLSEYRKGVVDEFTELKEKNKKKVNELAEKQVSLNNLEKELAIQIEKLGSNLASISAAAIDIKDEISDLKDLIKLYEKTYKCSGDEDISVCENRYYNSSSSSNGSLPSAAGFYRPVVSGRVNANYGYTEYYGSYHDGLDIGVSHGTAVYSIASGKVVKISYKSSCGGNMVYITHVVNGKTYTSGYFHLASINVRVGQIVTHNTVIGTSGGVPSIETWDRCSTGAHLHLQMGTGLYMTDYFWYSNYQARSFDPRLVINFPAWGSYFSGR